MHKLITQPIKLYIQDIEHSEIWSESKNSFLKLYYRSNESFDEGMGSLCTSNSFSTKPELKISQEYLDLLKPLLLSTHYHACLILTILLNKWIKDTVTFSKNPLDRKQHKLSFDYFYQFFDTHYTQSDVLFNRISYKIDFHNSVQSQGKNFLEWIKNNLKSQQICNYQTIQLLLTHPATKKSFGPLYKSLSINNTLP